MCLRAVFSLVRKEIVFTFLPKKGSPIKCHHLMTEKAKPNASAGCWIRNYCANLSREVPRTIEAFPARGVHVENFLLLNSFVHKLFFFFFFQAPGNSFWQVFEGSKASRSGPCRTFVGYGFNLFPLDQGLVFLFCLCNEASLVQPFRIYSSFLLILTNGRLLCGGENVRKGRAWEDIKYHL